MSWAFQVHAQSSHVGRVMFSGAASGAIAAAAVLGAALVGQRSVHQPPDALRVGTELAGAAASWPAEVQPASACPSSSGGPGSPELVCVPSQVVCECGSPPAPPSAAGSEGAPPAALAAAATAGAGLASASLRLRGSRSRRQRSASPRLVDAATQTLPQDSANLVPKSSSWETSSIAPSTPVRVRHGRSA